MSLQSDLILAKEKFQDEAISEECKELNTQLIEIMSSIPVWHEIGAEKYRQMRWNNETALPRPPVLEHGINTTIPSREAGRTIPIRVFKPHDGNVKGTFLHIHGGGWVLQSECYQDGLLDFMAQKAGLAVVSVGYRLAPEYPFPAGPEDCYDAAEWAWENAEKEFGAKMLFIGGESAGAHLSVLAFLHLHKTVKDFVFPSNGGLVLHFGAYDLSNLLPACQHFDRPLIINFPIMQAYVNAFLPNTTAEQRTDPIISPFYADWKTVAAEIRQRGGKGLPRALFTIGTEDPLLDDSVFMATKWQMSGGEGILKVYPGAAHGFIGFDQRSLAAAGEGLADTEAFLKQYLQ